jgi:hypothetical protein
VTGRSCEFVLTNSPIHGCPGFKVISSCSYDPIYMMYILTETGRYVNQSMRVDVISGLS